jgi:DNA-binding response OmpR family regulator
VLTDYNLPGINGIETARLIRARDPETSFVLMTGHPSEAVFAEARDDGARGILVKPFALAELRACLSAA